MPQSTFSVPRRDLLKLSAAGLLSGVSVPWFEALAGSAAVRRSRGKNCILVWLDGGPSQQHTFDPKPGGEFKSVSTTVPGIHIAAELPQLSQCMEDMILLRSMQTESTDHYGAKYHLHTGFRQVNGLEHPAIGCLAAAELGLPESDMPSFVTVDAGNDIRNDGGRLYRSVPAYLGPQYAPLAVTDPARGLENLRGANADLAARVDLVAAAETRFLRDYPLPLIGAKQAAFARALRLMQAGRSKAFDLDLEPKPIREEYGMHRFGQSCLLARRLVEGGVRFVEVVHRGWDDHEGAGGPTRQRAPWVDRAVATLIRDLKRRGMLDDTLVVWMAEFGRLPGPGTDHYSKAWTTMWAGGGLNTGIVIGKTNDGEKAGSEVTERPIGPADYMATLCLALGIDPHQELMGPGGRPMPMVEKDAKPVMELFS